MHHTQVQRTQQFPEPPQSPFSGGQEPTFVEARPVPHGVVGGSGSGVTLQAGPFRLTRFVEIVETLLLDSQ